MSFIRILSAGFGAHPAHYIAFFGVVALSERLTDSMLEDMLIGISSEFRVDSVLAWVVFMQPDRAIIINID